MLYFIPAWYTPGTYQEQTQVWYRQPERMLTDDMVRHMRLFRKADICSSQLLLPGYCPNLRHFLHQQQLSGSPYWSCFDALQQVTSIKMQMLSYHDLSWPEDAEFVYTNFNILCLQRGVKYACIEFGDYGNMIYIDLFEDGQKVRRNIYDDRGFLSSAVIFGDSQEALYQEYYAENGEWKLRHFLKDDIAVINPENPQFTIRCGQKEYTYTFQQPAYQSLELLLLEILHAYVQLTDEKDCFFIAADKRHEQLITSVLTGHISIVSFFGNRYANADEQQLERIIKQADVCMADTEGHTLQLKNLVPQSEEKMVTMFPYMVQRLAGKSGEISTQGMLVTVDDLDERQAKQLLAALERYMKKNKAADVTFLTRRGGKNRAAAICGKTGQAFSERVHACQCLNEAACMKILRSQRILIDPGKQTDYYMQSLALSFGVPIIALVPTQLVADKRNGMILGEIEKLPGAADWFLSRISRWNEAGAASAGIGKQYTAEMLAEKWRGILESLG